MIQLTNEPIKTQRKNTFYDVEKRVGASWNWFWFSDFVKKWREFIC